MPEGPIGRSELVGQSGVGAMTITRHGVSVIIAGLDHWFQGDETDDRTRYEVRDLRLEMALGVSRLLLPPSAEQRTTVPVLRFPQWHFCPNCRLLHRSSSRSDRYVYCPKCNSQSVLNNPATARKAVRMEQVPIVTACPLGHLQDFPWREWVHRSADPTCQMEMHLSKSGGFGLAAQTIRCGCKKKRSLAGVIGGSEESNLTRKLAAAENAPEGSEATPFRCRGLKPWLGDFGEGEHADHCTESLFATLRSSHDVYMQDQRSSIFLPEEQDIARAINELMALLASPEVGSVVDMAGDVGLDPVRALRAKYQAQVESFTDEALQRALSQAQGMNENDPEEPWQQSFRGKEFFALATDTPFPSAETRAKNDAPIFLVVNPVPPTSYGSELAKRFKLVNLVPKLRETRVLAGFNRINSDAATETAARKRLLWAGKPGDWLPAYVVFGEGIFIQFASDALAEWKQRNPAALQTRIDILSENVTAHNLEKRIGSSVRPEIVLVHTFSHILINRLVYECGYQTASLKERIFCSPDGAQVGLLIYTADGDSDGTLGGLVRMGRADRLPRVIQRALEGARWCSSDPVCRDVGGVSGQGPDSCNLAACHACAMVPETTCELGNRLLDRAMLVGSPADPDLGFFPIQVL